MQRRVLRELEAILRRESQWLSDMKKEYRDIKGGDLIVRDKGDKLIFSERFGKKETGITKDKERVRALSRKRYLNNEIDYTEKVCSEIRTTIIGIRRISDLRGRGNTEKIEGIEYSDRIIKWLARGEVHNPVAPENLKYRTASGLMVRSKSERTIADMLSRYGLAYKYDISFKLGGKIMCPDFVIMRWDGRIVIWEHFGLMENEEYRTHAIEKMITYNKYGYSSHTNFICTFEKDVEDTKVLDDIIQRFLL